jgi:hypothetical protein
MDNNPFVTVPSPNYAAPIVNFFGNQNQKPQQNQQQQNPQQQDWGQRLRAWLQQQQQQGDPALAAYNNPNLTMRQRVGLDPIDLNPGSVAGANTLTAGLY